MVTHRAGWPGGNDEFPEKSMNPLGSAFEPLPDQRVLAAGADGIRVFAAVKGDEGPAVEAPMLPLGAALFEPVGDRYNAHIEMSRLHRVKQPANVAAGGDAVQTLEVVVSVGQSDPFGHVSQKCEEGRAHAAEG